MLLSALMMIVGATRGPHWNKTPEQCLCLAKPLNDYLQTLPTKTAKYIAQAFLPLSVISGGIALVSEPLAIEKQLKELEQNGHASGSTTYYGGTGGQTEPPANGYYTDRSQTRGPVQSSNPDESGFSLRPDGHYTIPTSESGHQ